MQINSLEDIQKISPDDVIVFGLKNLNLSPDKLFLIIRNLSFPVEKIKIDFSDVEIDEWVENYLKTDVKIEIQDILIEVVKRICAFIDCSKGLDYTKYPKFICRNSTFLDKICNFSFSSIYYSVQLQTQKTQKFEETVIEPLPVNSIFVLNHIKDFETKLCSMNYSIKFYQHEFIDEHAIIFAQLLKTSLFGLMLYGSTTPEWNKFIELANVLYGITN